MREELWTDRRWIGTGTQHSFVVIHDTYTIMRGREFNMINHTEILVLSGSTFSLHLSSSIAAALLLIFQQTELFTRVPYLPGTTIQERLGPVSGQPQWKKTSNNEI